MTNLFSIFDPVAFGGISCNWVSTLVILSLIPSSFWVASSQMKKLLKTLTKSLYEEFKSISQTALTPGALWLGISAFSLVWLNNFLGLAPYIFTATSHLTLTLSLALPLWLGHLLTAWVYTSKKMFAHLVPLGSPFVLAPFMVCIELVSALIRPLTLSVRLAANMVAGHLLMALLSGPATSASYGVFFAILAALVMLALLEAAVATIQAYVFSILSVLYLNESHSSDLG